MSETRPPVAEVPLELRNRIMELTGYTPPYGHVPNDPELGDHARWDVPGQWRRIREEIELSYSAMVNRMSQLSKLYTETVQAEIQAENAARATLAGDA